MTVLEHSPGPPDWHLDWNGLREAYDWVDVLHECPQDAQYHAEGDVGIHTEMACRALAASNVFRGLSDVERRIVFAAVLMHDVAKPLCTKEEGARITSRGHSNRGEILTRKILWRQGVPFHEREAICGLVRYHQVPFFLVENEESRKLAYRVSQAARCDLLALVAWADGLGRECADARDKRRILDNVELFREYCLEEECLTGPRQFPSEHSRFLYFYREGREPNYLAHDDTVCEVTLLSGFERLV